MSRSWVVHPRFPCYVVLAEEAHLRIGGHVDPVEDRKMFATIIADYSRSRRRLSKEDQEKNARIGAAALVLLAVAECEDAMEMPVREGWPILERHGWDPKSDITPSAFIRRLRRAAIAKATGAQA